MARITINDKIIKALQGAGYSAVKEEGYILFGDYGDPDHPAYYKLTIKRED